MLTHEVPSAECLPRGPGTNKHVVPVLIRNDRKERSRVAVQQCLRRQSVSKIRLIVFNSSFNLGGGGVFTLNK